jgi:O-antigen ligase
LYETKFKNQIFFIVLSVAAGLVLVLTQSRESLVTLFIAVIGMIFILVRSKLYLKSLVVVMGLLFGIGVGISTIPRIMDTFSAMQFGDTATALSSRDQVWQSMFEIITTKPLGIGFETAYLLTNNTAQQAHNTFMQAVLIAGFAGLIAILFFIVMLFKMLLEQKEIMPSNWMIDAYLVFTVGYLATAMVSDHFISFFTFNAVYFGLLGFVSCAR